MICVTIGCCNQTQPDRILCSVCTVKAIYPQNTPTDKLLKAYEEMQKLGEDSLPTENQRRRAEDKAEFTGSNVDYYRLHIADPKRPEVPAYTAECEDIIEALNMTFAEGCAFKAIWRSAAARTLGLKKKGQDEHGVYDAEKVSYYGQAMLRMRKRLAAKK